MPKQTKNNFSNRIVYARDYISDAKKAKTNWGTTNRYSTGLSELDEYLWGGYGKEDGWEIIVIHGAYGLGKSTVALNFLAQPIRQGISVGIMALEDDPSEVVMRLGLALEDAEMIGEAINSDRIRLMPQESMEKTWTLKELSIEIEKWFTDSKQGVDILLLDHLQFAFDSADLKDERSEWAAQAIFMRELNALMKRVRKTILLVSQENRQGEVAGSIGIPRAASKMIGIKKIPTETGKLGLWLTKTRSTPPRDYCHVIELNNSRMHSATDQPTIAKRSQRPAF
jgi:KaiC/GvpD/RAD55 family RecA-like ATPase